MYHPSSRSVSYNYGSPYGNQYENTQILAPIHPARSDSSQSESPPIPHYDLPTSSSPVSYPPPSSASYPPSAYMNNPSPGPRQQDQSWEDQPNQGASWNRYTNGSSYSLQPAAMHHQQGHSPNPHQEGSYSVSPPPTTRPTIQTFHSVPPESGDTTASPAEHASPSPYRYHSPRPQNDWQSQSQGESDSSPGIDFLQLSRAYGDVINGAKSLIELGPSSPGQPSRANTLQVMLQSSMAGLQLLSDIHGPGSAAPPSLGRSSQPLTPSKEDKAMDVQEASEDRNDTQSDAQEAEPVIVCMGCQATSTPEWRRGPMGPRTLCNACGLVWAKMVKKRKARGKKQQDEDGSSDEDSDRVNESME